MGSAAWLTPPVRGFWNSSRDGVAHFIPTSPTSAFAIAVRMSAVRLRVSLLRSII
jgi:hypothetical protein